MPVDFQIDAELRDLRQYRTVDGRLSQVRTCARDPLAQLLLISGKSFSERFRIAIVLFASLDDLDAVVEIRLRHDFGVQSETVQQLRPQLTLFRVSRTNQDKVRRMFDGNALALDSISACRGDVQ